MGEHPSSIRRVCHFPHTLVDAAMQIFGKIIKNTTFVFMFNWPIFHKLFQVTAGRQKEKFGI